MSECRVQFRGIAAAMRHSGEYPSLGELCEQYLRRHRVQHTVLVSSALRWAPLCVIPGFITLSARFDHIPRLPFVHRVMDTRCSLNVDSRVRTGATIVAFDIDNYRVYSFFCYTIRRSRGICQWCLMVEGCYADLNKNRAFKGRRETPAS